MTKCDPIDLNSQIVFGPSPTLAELIGLQLTVRLCKGSPKVSEGEREQQQQQPTSLMA